MELKPFESKVWLSSPTMHGEELEYVKEAYETKMISIIMGIYNCAPTLEEALDSIINQTYKDWELIMYYVCICSSE